MAVLVAAGSVAFALTMSLFMLSLFLRRRRNERSAAREQSDKLLLSRELLDAIAGTEPCIMPAFDEAKPSVRLGAVSHLLQLLRGGDRARLLAVVERKGLFADALSRLHSRQAARRIDAMRLLEQFASPACIQGLTSALAGDHSGAVRLEAAGALARMGQLPPLADLVRMLELDRRPLTRLHQALFRSIAARDTDAIVALADDPQWRPLRAPLVDALGWIENYAKLETLAQYGVDTDAEVRAAALRAARKIGHPGAAKWVTALLDDPDERVRIQAAQTCGALRLGDARPALERLNDDPSWWVRMRARGALDLLGAGPAVRPA
ncbi:HEAT repeat domain-containing protein [Novosphingobium sp. Gsoil 351]|uniref:HEAT repeat domain-containing protein n=1 Tax=Novosphingobium sp. Gsoil 351 TaxID=2675225 RepID=UPI0018A806B6|nr:HEAT repeat domain-containing protein [Novosphingobium sp. Gsoil 351]